MTVAVSTGAGLAFPSQAADIYCTNGGVALQMTLVRPDGAEVGPPVPVALHVHGGGWRGGSRGHGPFYDDVADRLLARGVAVASVDYRLAPEHRFPAPAQDVACAVRSLRARAASFGLDPGRIGAWGPSAGGHLVSLVGTADPEAAGFSAGAYPGVSSRLQAVVDLYGPVDLTAPGLPRRARDLISGAFGTSSPDAAVLTVASPLTWASADDPAFLIVHGAGDGLIPLSQSEAFVRRLRAAGVRVRLEVVTGGNHGLDAPGQSRSPAEVADLVAGFLAHELATPGAAGPAATGRR